MRLRNTFQQHSRRIVMALFVVGFAAIGTTLLVLSQAAVSVSSVANGPWSSPSTWANGHVPEVGDTVTIATNVTYDVTKSPVLAEMYVKGTLTFDPNKSVQLVTQGNVVVHGQLIMRPASAAVDHFLQFVNVDESRFVGGGMEVLGTDVGLWVMDTKEVTTVGGVQKPVSSGKLDVAGTAKTSWTNATDSISAGATSVTLKDAPTGWRVGDEIIITPTEPPTAGNASYEAVEERKITAISGNTVSFGGGLSRPHPKVNNMWTAEVGNLTRNVRIEGTSTPVPVNTLRDRGDAAENRHTGNSHIFIHSSLPQAISNAALRYMGSTGTNETATDPMNEVKLGRYALHFHHNKSRSEGSVVDGVVVRDANFHQFVPHASDGITMSNNIAFNNKSGAFWWDPHGNDPESDSHKSVWNHNLVAKMQGRGDFIHSLGFFLPAGFDNKVINNSYVGAVQVDEDYGGYVWVNSNIGVWVFDGNTAHNNNSSGIRVWQNSPHVHPITNFVLYYNKHFGINHGAYTNDYNWVNGHVYGNEKAGISLHANSNTAVQQRYENVVWDGAGITPNLVIAAEAQLFHGVPILFRDNTFKNYKEHAILVQGTGGDPELPKQIDIVNSTFEGNSPIFYGNNSTNTQNVIRVQPKPGEGAPYQIKSGNARTDIAPFAPSQHYGTGTGLLTEYFSGSNFDNKIYTRLESTVSNNLAQDDDIPPPWLEPWESTRFMMRWTGEFVPQEDASYIFTADEYFKMRMWLDDQLVVDASGVHEAPKEGTPRTLKAGQRYKIRVEGNFSDIDPEMTPAQVRARRFYIFNLFVRKNEPGSVNRVLPRSQLYCGSSPDCNINPGVSFPTPTPTPPPPAPSPTPTPTPAPTPPPPPPPPADTTAPTVSITAPANNATVSGTFNVAANASDNVGVTQVEFLVDGQSRNTDPTAPYSFGVSTTQLGLGNGSHTIAARARDAANNAATSQSVTVTVNNPVPAPPPPPPTPTFAREDINEDGRIDLRDFSRLAGQYGKTNYTGREDINGDGKVSLIDFSLLKTKLNTN